MCLRRAERRWPEKNHCSWIYREEQSTQNLLAVVLGGEAAGVECGPCPQAEHGLSGETGSEATGLGAGMESGEGAPRPAGQRKVPGANEGGTAASAKAPR